MRTYYIEERDMEMTYIELRLFLYIECDKKINKITQILGYLHTNGFLVNLTVLHSDLLVDNIKEKKDVMSLTIDMRGDKLRFKFWNGASVLWLYHTEDLLQALNMGRNQFSEIYDKYEPVTDILFDFQGRWKTSIHRISYQYLHDDDFDVIYHIVFSEEVKNAKYDIILLKKIYDEVNTLGEDILKDLKFKISHSFKTSGCVPCEQAKKEREKIESKN